MNILEHACILLLDMSPSLEPLYPLLLLRRPLLWRHTLKLRKRGQLVRQLKDPLTPNGSTLVRYIAGDEAHALRSLQLPRIAAHTSG